MDSILNIVSGQRNQQGVMIFKRAVDCNEIKRNARNNNSFRNIRYKVSNYSFIEISLIT